VESVEEMKKALTVILIVGVGAVLYHQYCEARKGKEKTKVKKNV